MALRAGTAASVTCAVVSRSTSCVVGWSIRSRCVVRNVTDIDDKISARPPRRAVRGGVGGHHERAFAAAYDALGVLPPGSFEATGFVTQMVEYMQRIIDNGTATPPTAMCNF